MGRRGFFRRKFLPLFSPEKISGAIVPLITPLNEDNSVDFISLKALTARLLNKGVKNIFVFSTFSEQFFLSVKDRIQILECVLHETEGKAVVVAGCFGPTIEEVIERVNEAERFANFCVVNIPLDATGGGLGFADFFDSILTRSRCRIMIYHNKQYFGDASIDSFNTLLNWERFSGVISFSQNALDAREVQALANGVPVFEENEEVMFDSLRNGFSGTCCISSLLFPAYYLRLESAAKDGSYEELALITSKIQRLSKAIIANKKIQSVKYVLSLAGIVQPFCFEQLAGLTAEEMRAIEGALGVYKHRR